jgi:hypothetical protein
MPSYDRALWALRTLARLLVRHRPRRGGHAPPRLRPAADAVRRPRVARDVLHDRHGALCDQCDGHGVRADAVARGAAGGVGGVADGGNELTLRVPSLAALELITRDEGFIGSAYHYSVALNQILAAQLDVGNPPGSTWLLEKHSCGPGAIRRVRAGAAWGRTSGRSVKLIRDRERRNTIARLSMPTARRIFTRGMMTRRSKRWHRTCGRGTEVVTGRLHRSLPHE